MGGCLSPDQQLVSCYKCGKNVPRYALQNHNCIKKFANQNKSNGQPSSLSSLQNPVQKLPNISSNSNSNKGGSGWNNKAPITPGNTSLTEQKSLFLAFLIPNFPPNPNPFEPALYRNDAKQYGSQYIDIKQPVNSQRTLFKWKRQKTIFYPLHIKSFKPEIMRFRTFQQKLLWFRLNIEDLRVSWQKGCETLHVDRSNLIMSSKIGLQKINLRKQLKIKFDDQVVDDAGGLQREWMHMCIKQIFAPKTGLFQQCVTEQTAYKFVWDKLHDEQFAIQHISTLGLIIGKALFDRISLNCFLNRTILRQICGQTVLLHDVFSFDRQIYKSWRSIIDSQGAQNLFLNFTETKIHSDNTTQTIPLVENGQKFEVNDTNKYQYIYQIMQLYCNKSIGSYLKALISSIYKVVPQQFLAVFEPHELEMLLYGPQTINVKDWRQNTIYKGYKPNDQIVIWFWNVVQKYDEQKLANLLHYCTGSNRVPILGFKYLQSNRNTINKFTLQKVAFNKDNPYPKSYTCFNRLQLPEYSSMAQLQKYLGTVIKQEITHFGLK